MMCAKWPTGHVRGTWSIAFEAPPPLTLGSDSSVVDTGSQPSQPLGSSSPLPPGTLLPGLPTSLATILGLPCWLLWSFPPSQLGSPGLGPLLPPPSRTELCPAWWHHGQVLQLHLSLHPALSCRLPSPGGPTPPPQPPKAPRLLPTVFLSVNGTFTLPGPSVTQTKPWVSSDTLPGFHPSSRRLPSPCRLLGQPTPSSLLPTLPGEGAAVAAHSQLKDGAGAGDRGLLRQEVVKSPKPRQWVTKLGPRPPGCSASRPCSLLPMLRP